MKKIILATVIAIMTLTTPASANEFCDSIAEAAGTIMEARQEGVDVVAAMKIMSGDELMQTMVLEAYEYPKLSVKKNQEEASSEFRIKWYLICMRSIRFN